MIKKIFLLTISLFFILTLAAQAQEKIDFFDVQIVVNQDSSINISERINYDFGTEERHGIYRDIPINYTIDYLNYKLRLSEIEVLNGQNQPYNFSLSKDGPNQRIKIGDADKFVTGKQTYIIKYKVEKATKFFTDHDELHWNSVGNNWVVPINNASVEVILPAGIETKNVQIECFGGYFGSTTKCGSSSIGSTVSDGSVADLFFSQKFLDLGEALTVSMKLPKGYIIEPSLTENFFVVLKDNLILFLPFMTLIIMYFLWRRYGKDPAGRGTIIAMYEPPKELAPAEAGTLVDEHVNSKDITAEIIYLATKGYLKIVREEQKGFLTKKNNYRLLQLQRPDFNLKNYQQKLLDGLFKTGSNEKKQPGVLNEIDVKDLGESFAPVIKEVREEIYSNVFKAGYFTSNIGWHRFYYPTMVFGIGMFVSFFVDKFFKLDLLSGDQLLLNSVCIIISFIIVVVFGWYMPKKTQQGVLLKEHVLGFKEYLTVAEKDRLKFHNAPEKNPEKFEAYLPFAIALGVEEQWAEQFKDLYLKEPGWYEGYDGTRFTSVGFVRDLAIFNSLMVSHTSAYSSSSSGSSIGGGGFSGGGFGGGGGGSW